MNNNSASSSSKPSGAASGASGKNTGGVKSKYAIVKEGWGSRLNFQHSYGLKMDPDGIEEGNRILEAMQEADREELEASGKSSK